MLPDVGCALRVTEPVSDTDMIEAAADALGVEIVNRPRRRTGGAS
jgi:hypothetical protein